MLEYRPYSFNNNRKPTMQTDNTPISTYILIDTNNNKQINKVKLSELEVLNKNLAFGLNYTKYKYIKKEEIKNYE